MKMAMKMKFRPHSGFFVALLLALSSSLLAQTSRSIPNPTKPLPYAFSNFVWWSDEEIRRLLKQRLVGLGDAISPASATVGQIRSALKELLRENGITADVQSDEPSDFQLTAQRAPGAPEPAIVFSILSPEILIDKVVVSGASEDLTPGILEKLQGREGHLYSNRQDWLAQSDVKEELESKGYLGALVSVTHGGPIHVDNHYSLNLLVTINSGPQYHVASITADGGPLLEGRDLSKYFSQHVGDIAGAGPFGQLAGQMRYLYERYGYTDVEIDGAPILDPEHGMVSYHLSVKPGPLYHLRSLTIHNLDSTQQSRVQELLGMKPGDVFDLTAVNLLYRKLAADSSMAGYGFTFGPAKDIAASMVDLTLDFYKVSDKSSVTIQ